jgi:hypothetical protein
MHTHNITNTNSNTNYTCFHNSHGVFESLVHAARTEAVSIWVPLPLGVEDRRSGRL